MFFWLQFSLSKREKKKVVKVIYVKKVKKVVNRESVKKEREINEVGGMNVVVVVV
jgi:hypothetical protein